MSAPKQELAEIDIEELKNRTSEIIDSVERTSNPIVIKSGDRPVARIEPITEDDLLDRIPGLIRGDGQFDELELIPIDVDNPGEGSDAIIRERDEK